jgi:1,4-alpha-glucan branching enzyme
VDFSHEGFEWVDCSDAENSVIAFLRRPRGRAATVLVACNFTPVPRAGYVLGVPAGGTWREILNSDAREYGGSGLGNFGAVEAAARPAHGRPFSVSLTLPPLATLVLRHEAA